MAYHKVCVYHFPMILNHYIYIYIFVMECGTLWSIGILARIAAKDEFARMRFCFDPLSYLDVNK